MRAALLLLTLAAIASLRSSAGAVDLTKIDRSIRKEPVYQSKNPQYCLLAFGSEAKIHVWLVIDGDALYVDRNGNGDLTDPGERFNPNHVYHAFRPEVKLMRSFFLRRPFEDGRGRGEPLLSCASDVFGVIVEQTIATDDPDNAAAKRVRKYPFRVCVGDRRCGQDATLALASRPGDAPILYVDGPIRLALHPYSDTLHRGERCWLAIQGMNQGLGAALRTELPEETKEIHPVAEIECPPRWPGAKPIRFTIELPGRG
jgi:hypothetical protein